MTPKERAAMQQALEALEACVEKFYAMKSTGVIGALPMQAVKAAQAITALREALEQPDEIDWIETNKALAKEIIELKNQAEQEPVAWALSHSMGLEFGSKYPIQETKEAAEQMARQHMGAVVVTPLYAAPVQKAEQEPVAWWFQPPNKNVRPMFDTQQHGGKWQPLYAAPVRTKDLTDDEVDDVRDKTWCLNNSLREFARAVIAADREKNR